MSQSQEVKPIRQAPCAECTEKRSVYCKKSAECEAYQKWAKEYRELREENHHDR